MIYFDNAATTKPSSAAVKAITEALTESWGNPSSRHGMGRAARKGLEASKSTILKTLGAIRAPLSSLIFTGSGTEATNLAILGVCRSKTRRGRILVGDGEHSSVSEAVLEAEKEGFEIVRIPTVGGVLDLDAVAAAVNENTVLATFMLVNNETGARYDVEKAFATVKRLRPSVICHCDAVQAYMKVPFTVKSLGADMITLSAHKIGGPKGIGALYVDQALFKRREVSPVIFGGGQESGYRSGTENVPAAAGFAAAAEESFACRADSTVKMSELREYIIDKLNSIDGVRCNLPKCPAPHIISVTLPKIKSETMLHYLWERGIAVSSGSACSSHSRSLSAALTAFGIPSEEADTTIRISLCADNSTDEADALASALRDGVSKLAKIR